LKSWESGQSRLHPLTTLRSVEFGPDLIPGHEWLFEKVVITTNTGQKGKTVLEIAQSLHHSKGRRKLLAVEINDRLVGELINQSETSRYLHASVANNLAADPLILLVGWGDRETIPEFGIAPTRHVESFGKKRG
jgi:hypothetical protein